MDRSYGRCRAGALRARFRERMRQLSKTMNEDARKVLWRCRRGMKELDILLERFARERYETASEDEKRAFTRLLDLPDPDLVAYFFGHATPDEPELAHLARLIVAPRT